VFLEGIICGLLNLFRSNSIWKSRKIAIDNVVGIASATYKTTYSGSDTWQPYSKNTWDTSPSKDNQMECSSINLILRAHVTLALSQYCFMSQRTKYDAKRREKM